MDAEIDEGEFFRFRRLCATEVWQSAALALGPVAVLAELSAALRGAAAASWRPVEACLYALAAIAPALLPRGGRGGRGEPPPPPSPTTAASELDTVLGPLLAASAALPADAHSQLLRASLKLGGAFAAWLGKGAPPTAPKGSPGAQVHARPRRRLPAWAVWPSTGRRGASTTPCSTVGRQGGPAGSTGCAHGRRG